MVINIEIWKAYYYMYVNHNLNCNDLEKGFCHYMTSGRHNGNLLFDWKFYVQRNALPFRSLETALAHYLKNGILKNFVTHNLKSLDEVVCSFFDWKYYVNTYSLSGVCDLASAIKHWKCKGNSVGYNYNKYMGTLPEDATTIKGTKYITDTRDNIIIRHDDTVTVKNVHYAITNVLRDTYSTLLQRLLLLNIELIRLSSDTSFRPVTHRVRVGINTYINEIAHVIKNTKYGEKPLLIENANEENSVDILSQHSGINVHERSDYNFNRSMEFTLFVRETETFKKLEAGERAVYNSTWIELGERIRQNDVFISELCDEITLYEKYIDETVAALEKRLTLVNTIFTNMRELLPGYGEENIGKDALIKILQRQFELYKTRHDEFIKFLSDKGNSACYTSLIDTLEISTTPFNNIIVDLNDLANSTTSGLIGNVVFSIDNLEDTLDMYRKTNNDTVEGIHKNKRIVNKTREVITDLLQNYTNRDLSSSLIVENYNKLMEWKVGLSNDLDTSTNLQSKNSIIKNIINLFRSIRIRGSVTDEIVTEHLRRDTREKNIDEITVSIKTGIEYLNKQKELVSSLPKLLNDIKRQSQTILHDEIFNKNFFYWECSIESLDRVEKCFSDRNLGRHVLRLPYGIALDVRNFNPLKWGIDNAILIRGKRPEWRSIDIYTSNRLQYSIGIDNMNLNITTDTIRLNSFEDVQNSIRTVDAAVEQLIVNLKHLRNSYARV